MRPLLNSFYHNYNFLQWLLRLEKGIRGNRNEINFGFLTISMKEFVWPDVCKLLSDHLCFVSAQHGKPAAG